MLKKYSLFGLLLLSSCGSGGGYSNDGYYVEDYENSYWEGHGRYGRQEREEHGGGPHEGGGPHGGGGEHGGGHGH